MKTEGIFYVNVYLYRVCELYFASPYLLVVSPLVFLIHVLDGREEVREVLYLTRGGKMKMEI